MKNLKSLGLIICLFTSFVYAGSSVCDSNFVTDQTKTKVAYFNKDSNSFFIKDILSGIETKITGYTTISDFIQAELVFVGPKNDLLIVMNNGPHYILVDSNSGKVLSQYSQVADRVRNNGINSITAGSPNGKVITSFFDHYFTLTPLLSVFDTESPDSSSVIGMEVKPWSFVTSDDGKIIYAIDDKTFYSYDIVSKKFLFKKDYNYSYDEKIRWYDGKLVIGCKLYGQQGQLLKTNPNCDKLGIIGSSDDFSTYLSGDYIDANGKPIVLVENVISNKRISLDNSKWNGASVESLQFSSDMKRISLLNQHFC